MNDDGNGYFSERENFPRNGLDTSRNGDTLLGRRAGLDRTNMVSASPSEGLGLAAQDHSTTNNSRIIRLSPEYFSKSKQGNAYVPPGITHYPVSILADSDEPEPRAYAVEGFVPYGAATIIYGEGGVAKSMLAMSLCTSLANESEYWLGRKLDPCAALYIDFELTQDEQLRRVYRLCRGSGYSGIPRELYYLSGLGREKEDVFWSAYNACAWYGVRFVVIDSWGPALQGDAKEASVILEFFSQYIEAFITADIAVLLIDHQAKGGVYQQGSAFGSVFKRNLVRSEMQIEKTDESELDGTVDLTFRHRKHNFGPLSRPFSTQLTFRDGETRVNTVDFSAEQEMREQGIPVPDRVMMVLESASEPMTSQDIADLIEVSNATTKYQLALLRQRNKVVEAGQRRGVPTYEVAPTMSGPVYYEPSEDEPKGGHEF